MMKWDEEKLRTYSEMRKSGATAEEISAVLGCDRSTVYRKTKELNRKSKDSAAAGTATTAAVDTAKLTGASTDETITTPESPKPEPLVTLKPEYKKAPTNSERIGCCVREALAEADRLEIAPDEINVRLCEAGGREISLYGTNKDGQRVIITYTVLGEKTPALPY